MASERTEPPVSWRSVPARTPAAAPPPAPERPPRVSRGCPIHVVLAQRRSACPPGAWMRERESGLPSLWHNPYHIIRCECPIHAAGTTWLGHPRRIRGPDREGQAGIGTSTSRASGTGGATVTGVRPRPGTLRRKVPQRPPRSRIAWTSSAIRNTTMNASRSSRQNAITMMMYSGSAMISTRRPNSGLSRNAMIV
jgi:hypothetical protein